MTDYEQSRLPDWYQRWQIGLGATEKQYKTTNEGYRASEHATQGRTIYSSNLWGWDIRKAPPTSSQSLLPHIHSWSYNYHTSKKHPMVLHGCQKFSSFQILTLLSLTFPYLLFLVCTTGSRLMEHMAYSPALCPCRCFFLGLRSSLSPHFLPIISSLPAQHFWSPAGSPLTDILVTSSLAPPCGVYISIRAHSWPPWMKIGWIPLYSSSTTFTYLEAESVSDSFP